MSQLYIANGVDYDALVNHLSLSFSSVTGNAMKVGNNVARRCWNW